MLSEGLKFFSDTQFPLIAMIIFIFTFFGIALWTLLRSKSKEYYNQIALLPLIEETSHERG